VRGFTPAQVIGFGMIPLGIGLLIYFYRTAQRSENSGLEAAE